MEGDICEGRDNASRMQAWVSAHLRSAPKRLSLLFGDGEYVAVEILEPSHFRTGWRLPDPQLVLTHPRESLEHDALSSELAHRGFRAGDMPAENRERMGRELLDR